MKTSLREPSAAHATLAYTRVSPERCVFARLHNVALQVWFAQCEETDALALADASRQMQQEFPGGISTVHWLRNAAAMPTAKARQHLAHMMDTQSGWFGEVGVVLDGTGFWAGAARAMLTGIRLAAGQHAGFRVLPTPEACDLWLESEHTRRTGEPLAAGAVAAAMREIVAQHG